MCTIIETLKTPIPEGIGYKRVLKKGDDYFGLITNMKLYIGKAPALPPMYQYIGRHGGICVLTSEVSYNEEHCGRYSFYKNCPPRLTNDIITLRCVIKNITHTTVFSNYDCFLAEEIVSWTEV